MNDEELWDFDENKNYITVKGYKVLNYKDAEAAANLLIQIRKKINKLFFDLRTDPNPKVRLLLNTPYKLQEMQKIKDQNELKFEGLNKPKEVFMSKEPKIGVDGSLRAKYRIIFLTLRDTNGKLKKIQDLYPLIAHELTHTAMNHVRWRDDDHSKEFIIFYKSLLRLLL